MLLGRFSVADEELGVWEKPFDLNVKLGVAPRPSAEPSTMAQIRTEAPIRAPPKRGLKRVALAQIVEPADSEKSTADFDSQAPGRTKRSVS
jgi:hypothetical protein